MKISQISPVRVRDLIDGPPPYALWGSGRTAEKIISSIQAANIPLTVVFDRSLSTEGRFHGVPLLRAHNAFGFEGTIIIACQSGQDLDSYLQFLGVNHWTRRLFFEVHNSAFRDCWIALGEEAFSNLGDQFDDSLSRQTFKALYEHAISSSVVRLDEVVRRPQYFSFEGFKMDSQSIFCDLGAFTGDTIHSLLSLQPQPQRIDCFEISSLYCEVIRSRFHQLVHEGCLKVYNFAVSDSSEASAGVFDGSSGMWSLVDRDFYEGGGGRECEVQRVTTLDDIYLSSAEKILSPTHIKMDIEGSEINALRGAQELIKSTRPNLAICAYHQPTDLIDIANLVLELNPGYLLALRAHECMLGEFVLYAY